MSSCGSSLLLSGTIPMLLYSVRKSTVSFRGLDPGLLPRPAVDRLNRYFQVAEATR